MPLLFMNSDVILSWMITCMHCAVHWVMFEAVQICWVQWWMCSYVYAARWRPCWSKVIENCVSRQEKIVHDWILSNEWTPVCHLGQCKWFSVIWCILTSHNELLLHDAVVTNLHVFSTCQHFSLWHLATLGCFFGQAIIFLTCGFFFCLSFFSSPNLSRRRLDVCHTSTHGVALVQI